MLFTFIYSPEIVRTQETSFNINMYARISQTNGKWSHVDIFLYQHHVKLTKQTRFSVDCGIKAVAKYLFGGTVC